MIQGGHEDLPFGEDPDDDEIMAELHQVRREIMAEFNYDLDAYIEHLNTVEEEERARGARYSDRPLAVPHRAQPRE